MSQAHNSGNQSYFTSLVCIFLLCIRTISHILPPKPVPHYFPLVPHYFSFCTSLFSFSILTWWPYLMIIWENTNNESRPALSVPILPAMEQETSSAYYQNPQPQYVNHCMICRYQGHQEIWLMQALDVTIYSHKKQSKISLNNEHQSPHSQHISPHSWCTDDLHTPILGCSWRIPIFPCQNR